MMLKKLYVDLDLYMVEFIIRSVYFNISSSVEMNLNKIDRNNFFKTRQ